MLVATWHHFANRCAATLTRFVLSLQMRSTPSSVAGTAIQRLLQICVRHFGRGPFRQQASLSNRHLVRLHTLPTDKRNHGQIMDLHPLPLAGWDRGGNFLCDIWSGVQQERCSEAVRAALASLGAIIHRLDVFLVATTTTPQHPLPTHQQHCLC